MLQTTPGAGGSAGGQAQQRELVYRVRVVADTSQANQAFQQMAGHAQRAAYQQPAAYQGGMPGGGMQYQPGSGWVPAPAYMGGGPGAPGGGSGGAGSGGGDKNVGIAAGYAVMMSRLTVAVGFVTQAMEKFRSVMDAVNTQGRETVNAQAKMEAWMNVIPVVGKPLGEAMTYGAGLQERFGRHDGRGYLAKADASGRTFQVQTQIEESWAGRRIKDANRSPLGILVGAPLAQAVLPAVGEFAGADQEYAKAQDELFRAPYDAAREAARVEARNRRLETHEAYRSMSTSVGAKADDARAQSRLLFPADRGGARLGAEFDAVSGWFPNLRRESQRTRFDDDDGYDQLIRGAERGRVGAMSGLGLAGDELHHARTGRLDAAMGLADSKSAFDVRQRAADDLAKQQKDDPVIQQSLKMALNEAEKASAKYAEQLGEYQKALNKEKEKTVSLAQAEYELSQKSLGVQQARLAVVEGKLKANDTGVEGFAFMNGGQRQGLLDSAKQLRDGGFDSLSPRQRELLAGSGISSDFLRQKARDYTNADPEARSQLDELYKATGQRTRTELLEQQKKLQAEIELKFVSNPEQLAEHLRKAFKSLDPELRSLIAESLRLERGKIDRQEAAARTQNK